MATFIFTKNILENKPIQIFNFGKMKRDFTFVDDIVSGIYGAIKFNPKQFHKIYNLGNSKSELLLEFIKLIEDNLGKNAKKKLLPLQPGDVTALLLTYRRAKKI